MTTQKWTDERVAELLVAVGSEDPVSITSVQAAALQLGVSDRSVASKLRKLGREVTSMAKATTPTFTEDEAVALESFVVANSGNMTYAQIGENFANGKFTAKQVQGKILSRELTAHVKPTEKVEAARLYTEAEEVKFVEMCTAGAFVEDIATALGKSVNSVRGKALSMLRTGEVAAIPAQRESHAKTDVDGFSALENVESMTVEQIATALGKTDRGVKTILTRRGINVANYKGADKKAKNELAKTAE